MGNKSSAHGHSSHSHGHGHGGKPKKPFHKWEREMLKSTFDDLASRSSSGKSIDKETFLKFFSNVPGMLGERLFHVFNTKKTGEIDFEEFIGGLATYSRGSPEQKVKFLFAMYDLDGDGRVSRNELETVLTSFVFAAEAMLKESGGSGVNSLRNSGGGKGTLTDPIELFQHQQRRNESNGKENDSDDSAVPEEIVGRPPALFTNFETADIVQTKRVKELVDSAFKSTVTSSASTPATPAHIGAQNNLYPTFPPTSSSANSSQAPSPSHSPSHAAVAAPSNLAVAAAASLSLSTSSQTYLTFYEFGKWLQHHPELLQVLDLIFAGKEEVYLENELSSSDISSSAASRGRGRGDTIIGEKSSNSKNHGRAVSVSSLISPQMQTVALATNVPVNASNVDSLSSVHIPASMSMGLPLSTSSPLEAASALVSGSPNAISRTSSLTSPSPRPGGGRVMKCDFCLSEIAIKFCFKCGQRLSGIAPLSCSSCGEIFLGSQLNFCFVCGYDLSLAGQKIEPPLLKSLAWQRTHGAARKAAVMEGYLYKVGARLKTLHQRWYVIRDNFMYSYAKPNDFKPSHVMYLEGCFAEPVNHEEKNNKLKYGIEIILNETTEAASAAKKDKDEGTPSKSKKRSRFLYAKTAEQRQQWIEAIRTHANVHNIEEFYQLGEEVGVGRFSSVRIGVSKNTGKKYAVKIMDKSEVDEKEREALRTEIAVLKLLNHPNIIRLKNVFETRKQIFIVMTFVAGGDLFERIQKRKRFSEALTQAVMFKLLSVVSYLHFRGIVHRDLKPENIMLRNEVDDADIVIGDFGLSKFAVPTEMMSMACGTLAYVAPEVLKGSGYGREVDLWACGVIMYLLVRGVLPFDGKHQEEIIAKTLAGKVSFDHILWREISEEAKSLISGLLETEPQHRFNAQQALDHPFFKIKFKDTPINKLPNVAELASMNGTIPINRERENANANTNTNSNAAAANISSNANGSGQLSINVNTGGGANDAHTPIKSAHSATTNASNSFASLPPLRPPQLSHSISPVHRRDTTAGNLAANTLPLSPPAAPNNIDNNYTNYNVNNADNEAPGNRHAASSSIIQSPEFHLDNSVSPTAASPSTSSPTNFAPLSSSASASAVVSASSTAPPVASAISPRISVGWTPPVFRPSVGVSQTIPQPTSLTQHQSQPLPTSPSASASATSPSAALAEKPAPNTPSNHVAAIVHAFNQRGSTSR